jgi:hypothetical protein
MSNRRLPRAKAPSCDDKNQLSFIDQLVVVATNLNVLSTAVFGTLGVTATLVGEVRSNYSGVLHRLDGFLAYALLAFLTIRAFKAEVERSSGIDDKLAARRLYRIGAGALLVLLSFLFYGEVKTRVLEWETGRQVQQRQLDEQRERDQQKKEQDNAAARKAEEEARKAERIRCEQDRKWVIAQADKEKPEAHKSLVTCTEAYERKKKVAEDTVGQRCWSEFNALQSIERRKQAAEGKRCDVPAPK